MPVFAHPLQIEDGDAGRLAACSRGCGNRDERLERSWHRKALADRRVHVVEKIRRRICDVQVDGFRRVDRRSAADGDDPVKSSASGTAWLREVDRVEKRFVGGFHPDAIKERG